MTQLLLLHGSGVDTSYHGLTPLDFSLHTQQPDITDLLVSLGARTKGGVHHRAASLIQLRYRLLIERKRKLQRIKFWTPFLQTNVRGFLAKIRFHKARKVHDSSIDRAAIVIQRYWRAARTARKKFQESYEVLRARLRAEKTAYALILEEIKKKEVSAMTRPVTNMSRHRKSRQTPCVLPQIPMVQSAPCVPRFTPLPRVKPPPSLSQPQPTPPPQMTVCLDQYKSLTDQYQSLRAHLTSNLPPAHSTPVAIKSSLKQALNQAIVLRSDTDRLTLPHLPPDSTRAIYHLKL